MRAFNRAILASVSAILAACVSATLSEPRPRSDLSAAGPPLSLDLRVSAGIEVSVGGLELDLLVLPHADSLLILDKQIAEQLHLKPIMWGLGTVNFTDGDYRLSGQAYKTTYQVQSSLNETAWVLVLDENLPSCQK